MLGSGRGPGSWGGQLWGPSGEPHSCSGPRSPLSPHGIETKMFLKVLCEGECVVKAVPVSCGARKQESGIPSRARQSRVGGPFCSASHLLPGLQD